MQITSIKSTKKLSLSISAVSLLACFASVETFAAATAETKLDHQAKTQKIATTQDKAAAITRNKITEGKKIAFKKHKKINKPYKSSAPLNANNVTEQPIVAVAPQTVQAFKAKPRASLWGMTGSYTMAKGQALVPFYADQNQAFFGIVEGNVVAHDSTWMVGGGLGYRKIVNDYIYGGYFIADYNKLSNKNNFWIANPGLEMLGKTWDFGINAYFTLNSSKVRAQDGWAADNFGNYNYLRFTGHNRYDHRLQEFDQAGKGFDFRVGRVVPSFEKAKVYIGGYHFDTQDAGSINGVSAKITYELNKYTALELTNNYDNLNHNRTMVGVKLTLGGYTEKEKKDFGLSTRLLDTIDHGYNQTIVPIKKTVLDKGEVLQYDNVWFFKPAPPTNNVSSNLRDAEGQGTAENPFVGATNDNFMVVYNNRNIGKITAAPMLYFQGGEYSLASFNASAVGVPTGWGVFGRTLDYKLAAVGDQRPVFLGKIFLEPDDGAAIGGNNVFDSLVLLNDYHEPILALAQHYKMSTSDDAIFNMQNVRNVTLRNVTIGADSFEDGGYFTGLKMDNATVNLYDTDIHAVNDSTSETYNAIGINASNDSIVNFMGGTNTVTSTGYSDYNMAYGIVAEDSVVNFYNGINAVNAAGIATEEGRDARAVGIEANYSSINFLNGNNSVTAITDSDEEFAGDNQTYFSVGISAHDSAINFLNGSNNIQGVTNNLRGDASYYYAQGMRIFDTSVNFVGGKNLVNATINGNGGYESYCYLYGINALDSAINFFGGTNTVSATNTSNGGDNLWFEVYGISATSSSIVFGGGINSINAGNYGSAGSFVQFYAYGIDARESSILFGAGENSISAENSISGGNASFSTTYGILAQAETNIHFIGKGTVVKVSDLLYTDSKSIYGISTDVGSTIAINGSEILAGNIGSLLSENYVNIYDDFSAYDNGAAIERNGIDVVRWSKEPGTVAKYQELQHKKYLSITG